MKQQRQQQFRAFPNVRVDVEVSCVCVTLPRIVFYFHVLFKKDNSGL